MFALITTRAHVTKSHHPLLHLNYLVTPSQFCVYNQKRRLRRYLKAANFSRSMRFLEVKRLRKIEGSNRSFWCFWLNKESDGDAELEAEIMEFMDKSEKPSMFPTKEELLKAGRMDLVEAIKKKCGWYSLGWEGENVDEDADFKIEELQSRVESCSESSSLGEIDANSQLPSSSSGKSGQMKMLGLRVYWVDWRNRGMQILELIWRTMNSELLLQVKMKERADMSEPP